MTNDHTQQRGLSAAPSQRRSRRLRALLVGTALGGSIAVIATTAPTAANAACAGPTGAVVCTAGEYPTITYSTSGALNVTLEPGVVVHGVLTSGPFDGFNTSGVTLQAGGDIYFSAGPGTSTNGPGGGGVELWTTSGSIVAHSENTTGGRAGIQASTPDGTVTIHSTSAQTTGFASFLPAAIGATGFEGVVIEAVDAFASGNPGHGVLGASDGGTVSIVMTGEVRNDAAETGVGIGGIGRFGVTIDSAVVRTEGTYGFALLDLPYLDVVFDEFVPSAGIHGRSHEGDVQITSDDIATLGDGAIGIYARAHAGDVTIDSTKIATQGGGATGILVNAAGKVDITSTEITTSGDILGSVDEPVMFDDEVVVADAIHATSTGDAITINSGTASTSGLAARGIHARTQSGAITIDAGLTTASGDSAIIDGVIIGDLVFGPLRTADAIQAESVSGAISITSQEAHATGMSSVAILATTMGGSIAVSSGTATGVVGGIRANALTGTVSIDSGSVEVAGQDNVFLANGIHAYGLNGVTITSGTVVTHATASYGILGNASNPFVNGGSGTVDIKSDVVTTTGAAGGGIGGFGEGDVTIDSGIITTTGAAIHFSSPAGSAYASGGLGADSLAGDVSVTSGSISTQGELAFGLLGRAAAGAVTIASGSVATAGNGAAGVIAIGSGPVSIISQSASTAGNSRWMTGDLSAGHTLIYSAELAHADAIHAKSTAGGIAIVSGQASASGLGARAIHAEGAADISITASSASATGGGLSLTDDVRLSHAIFARSTGGAVDIDITGAVTSAQAAGIHAEALGGAISIDVGAQAIVSGAHAGINTSGEGGASIVNRGTIRNTVGGGDPDLDYAAINIAGSDPTGSTVTNFGAIIAAGNGPAIWFDAGDDTVNLMTGSVISGAVVGAGGLDTVNLIGASNVRTATQSLAHFVEFEQLNVTQGYWTASGQQSEFASVFIGANGGLEVGDFLSGGEFLSAVAAPSVVNNGLLVINFAGGSEDTGDLFVTGVGILRLSGAGTFNVNTNTLAHTGGTIIDAGKLVLTGALQGDMVINAGGTFQIGNGGTAGGFAGDILDNGTLIFDRSDNYEFTGGLYGSGSLVKKGANQLFLSGEYGFTGTTTVLGGTLKLANIDENAELAVGGGELDLSGGDHQVAGLTGEGGEVNIDDGSLTINVEGADVFGGEISGDGELTVSGGGTLNLTGDSTYTGDTSVEDGVLKVNGSIVSDVFIAEGGTLGGNGTVGGVNVDDGGTVGPGNSIGLLNVSGDVAFGPGAFYEVEANAAGQSDRIVATGEAVLTGGTVTVLAETGVYNRLTTYNILTAAGGVTGEFDAVTSNFAYLSASLDYTGSDVLLTLARNDIAFSTLAVGANQAAVADAVEAGGEDLYDAVLFQTDAGAQQAFTALSGEFYGAAPTALLAQSRYSREATLGRLRDAEEGSGVWGAAYGAHQTWDAGEAVRNQLGGVMFGADMGMGAWRLGAAVGQERSRAKAPSLGGESETQSTTLAVYGGLGSGALSARLGVSHAWHDIEAAREVSFPTFTDSTTAELEGATTQLFGEVGYKLALGGGTFEPFANLAAARVTTDAFVETGGAAALAVAEIERQAVFSSIGARFTVQAQLPFGVASPYVSVAYGAASGDLDGLTANTFDTGEAFEATGASLADNAVLFDTGFDWRITDAARAGLAYQGAFGDDADEQSVRLELSIRF